MAVIVQYIVVRDGVHKMTFTTKKEADAYDKMLDIADNLYDFMETADIEADEKLLEDLTFYLAKNREKIISILRGTKPKKPLPEEAEKPEPEEAEKPKSHKASDKSDKETKKHDTAKPASKVKPKKKKAKKK